jgi:radical SAM protein with 4Fe4S-binding SPASM domain
MINEDLYPVTSGHMTVKKKGESHLIMDVRTGLHGEANEDLRDLLILCDGTRTVREILEELPKKYKEPKREVEIKAIKSIEFLVDLHFLDLTTTPHYFPIDIRDTDMEWPLNIIYVEMTTSCNLSCIHCYKKAGESLSQELGTLEWYSIIDELKGLGALLLAVTGGEPLMRKDIFSIMEYAADNNLGLLLFTNGTLITEESAQRLKDIGVEQVIVSIDGATKETHEMIRGKNTFDKVVRNIQLLRENDINVRSNTVLFTHSIPELESVVQMLLELDVQEMVFDRFMSVGRGKEHERLIPPLEAGELVAAQFERFKKESPQKLELTFTSEIEKLSSPSSFCGIGTSACVITANGNVGLCPVLSGPEHTAGNVKDTSIRDLWLKSDIFQPFRTCGLDDMVCSTCGSKMECKGGCKARAIQYYGKACMPDPWMCATRGQKWPTPV